MIGISIGELAGYTAVNNTGSQLYGHIAKVDQDMITGNLQVEYDSGDRQSQFYLLQLDDATANAGMGQWSNKGIILIFLTMCITDSDAILSLISSRLEEWHILA